MNFFHHSVDLKSGENVRNNLQPSYTSGGFFQEDGFINFKTKLTGSTDDISRDFGRRAELRESEPISLESQNVDSEALNCIKEILDLLYKVREGTNDKIEPIKDSNKLAESVKLGNFRECCRNKNESNLNKLLSFRLNQISKLKEHCIDGDFQLSCRTDTQRTGKVKSLSGRGYLRKPVINVSESRSDFWLLTFCSKSLRWKSSNDNIGDIYWLGYSVTPKQLGEIISNNKRIYHSKIAVNRFTGIQEITKKGIFYHLLEVYSTHKLLNITQNTTTDTCNNSFNNANYLPDDSIVRCWPRSFMLPDNLNKVLKLVEKNVPLIFKPSNGSMGQGVRVVTVPEDINEEMLVDYTAQEYVSIPLLINGKKFDIRLYLLLIASNCDNSPGIKGFIFKNSLVRFCTENYEYPSVNNSNNSFMHLTNYNINKANVTKYHRGGPDDENNSKRPLKSFLKTLEMEGYNPGNIWSQITNICSITIQTIYPDIYLSTRISRVDNFQIFGLDVMIDVYGRVWLLEVNCCPSLKTSYFDGKEFREDEVDLMIKVPLITDALKIVNITLNGYSGHDKKFYSKFEDWDEVSISEFKPELTLAMELFKRAKGEFLENKYITKREWNKFCKSTGITEIITVTTIDTQNTIVNIESSDNFEDMVKKSKVEGRKILNRMFGEVVKDSQGVCFGDFAVLLGRCCKIIENWIKISDNERISTICKGNNFLIPLEIFRWSISKPHNSISHPETYVFSKFLHFINDRLSLSHSKLV